MKKILLFAVFMILSVSLSASVFEILGSCVIRTCSGEIIRTAEVNTDESFLLLGGSRISVLKNDVLTIESLPGAVVSIRESETGIIIGIIDGEVTVAAEEPAPVMITTPASKICGIISGRITVSSTSDKEAVLNRTGYSLILYDDIRVKSITQESYTSYDFFTETTAEL